MTEPLERRLRRTRQPSLTNRYTVSLGGRILGALLQALVLAFLARSLGVMHFGTVAVTMSVAQFGFSLLELGFTTRLLRLRDDPRASSIFGALLVVRGASVVAILVVAAVAVILVPSPLDKVLVGAAAGYTVGEGLGDLSIALFQGELRSTRAVAILLARRSIAVLPFMFGLTPTAAVTGLILAGLAGNAAFWPAVVRRAARPMSAREVLRINGPITVATLAFNVQQTDSALMSTQPGLTSLYGASARLANPIMLAISTLIQVIIPEFDRLEPRPRYSALRRARRLILLLAALVAASSLLSPLVVRVLYGEDFAAAVPIVAAVFIGAAFSAVAQVHLAWLYVEGLSLRWAVVILGAVLAALVELLTLAILFGVAGAALGYVTMQATIFASIYIAFVVRSRPIRREFKMFNAASRPDHQATR